MTDSTSYSRILPYDIVDIHAHFFPRRWFESIWEFFEGRNWPINYKGAPEELAGRLRGFGVSHFTTLNYLHKAGLRDGLAEWTRVFAETQHGAIPFGTLYPGEPGNLEAARRWFSEWNFAGLKIQPLVSRKPIGDPSMYPVYELMAEMKKWLIVHAGTAPYPNEFTRLEFLAKVLRDVPGLPVILAHMGGYEFETALDMMEEFPNLALDTTMIFVDTDVVAGRYSPPLERLLPYEDRILFGSDFPNIPYNYEESVNGLLRTGLPGDFLRKVFRDNAVRMFGL